MKWPEHDPALHRALMLIVKCEAVRQGLEERGFHQMELSFCPVFALAEQRDQLVQDGQG